MAGNTPPDATVDDRQQHRYSVPAANVREAVAVAQMAAIQRCMARLSQLYDTINAGSGITSPASIQRALLQEIETLRGELAQHWEEYVQAAATHPLHADSIKAAGMPEHITYDPKVGIPFLVWVTAEANTALIHDPIRIRLAEDKSGEPFILTSPFKLERPDCLPANSLTVNVLDKVHAATIAMYEVMEHAYQLLSHARTSVSARDSWHRMRSVATFYSEHCKDLIKGLTIDDYRDWQPTLPAQIPILNAASTIARHASNANLIQILALRTVSSFLLDSLDRSDSEPGNHSHADKVDQVLGEMANYLGRIRVRYDSLNALLVSENVEFPEQYVQHVISRPMPRGVPLIALIPLEQAGVSYTNVTALRRA